MDQRYRIADTSAIFSPGLIFYKDLIRANIAEALRIAGSPSRLRPHAKTHKSPQVARMELDAGVSKHKCATLAEAEMLAEAGAGDVMLAYPIVGPNRRRMVQLMRAYPRCRFSVTMDDLRAVQALSAIMAEAGLTLDVMIDLDVGMHRTGIPAGPEAAALYEQIHKSPGLRADGLHTYDGHNHQEGLVDRETAVRQLMEPVLAFRATLETKGLPVPRIVAGGTPTFPVFARLNVPGLECSPGTVVLHDTGYGNKFTDMAGFVAAALLLTRVISRPTPTRLTLDLGYKAVASDPPAGKRLTLFDLPNAQAVLQNEEHLVIETPDAGRYSPGDEFLAIPTHVCPTCAMHQQAYVVEGGKLVGTWNITARNRMLTV